MVYSSVAQVDAVAACTLSSALFSEERTEDSDAPLLAVAQSQLESNVWNGGVALLDSATNEQLCELQLESGVSSLAWCGVHSDILALGCDDGDVRLAQLCTDVAFAFVPITDSGWGHDNIVTGVSVSKVEKTKLASCSWDLTVKLWDIEANKPITTLEGHTDLIWGIAWNVLHPHLLCSASQDTTVRIWDARQPQSDALEVTALLPLSIDWHPKQATVFSIGQEDGTVCTFDMRSLHGPLAQHQTHKAAVHVLKYSSYHEDMLATGGDDAKAFVMTGSFSSEQAPAKELKQQTAPHRDYVRALDWFQLPSSFLNETKLNTMLATGSWDKSVHTWQVKDFVTSIGDDVCLKATPDVSISA